MARLLILATIQSLLLCSGQVMLKLAMVRTGAFTWSWSFFLAALTNWWFLGFGIVSIAGGLMWMYILKYYAFSMAYPLASLAYVFGMIASIFVFHETVAWTQWVGVLLIMGGCALVAQ